jgi:hypothetical protein
VSPSASVALPVSANGVRSGIVNDAGAVTTGALLPVALMLPLLSTGPPLSVSPTKPVTPLRLVSESGLTFVSARGAVLNATWKPSSEKAPLPPKGPTDTVPPGHPGMPWIAFAMSAGV